MIDANERKVVRILRAALWVVLAVFAVFMLRVHWVRAYSDPAGWVDRAILFYEQGSLPRIWSVVYPLYLYWPFRLLGPHYVYISNLPWIIFLVIFLGGICVKHFRYGSQEDLINAFVCCLWTVVISMHLGWGTMGELINPYREAVAFSLLLGAFFIFSGKRGISLWRCGVTGVLFGLSVAMREPHLLAIPALFLLLLYMLYSKLPNRAWLFPPVMIGGILLGLLPFLVQNHMSSGYWWVPIYIARNLVPIVESLNLHPLFIIPPWAFVVTCLAILTLAAFFYRDFSKRPSLTVEQRRKYWKWIFLGMIALLLTLIGVLAISLYSGLIPHMDIDRFRRVGPRTVRFLRGQWGWMGLSLFFAGVVGMLARKEWRLFIITVPSVLLFLFFWSFYAYVKPRYVFSVQVFAYPIMGYGAFSLTCFLGRFKPLRAYRNMISLVPVLVAAFALMLHLGWKAVQGSESLKVWQIPRIRDEIEAVVERPMIIDCANWRHTCLLSTIMATRETHMFDIWRRNSFEVDWRAVQRAGDLDLGLQAVFDEIVRDVTENHVYDYGPRRTGVRFWLDRIPVINLGTVSGRLDLYGSVMDENLYKLAPWSQSSFSYSLEDYPVEEDLLLGLDLFRLWDHADRTYAKLASGDYEKELPEKNHFLWVELPAGDDRDSFTIESDAPLPREAYVRVLRKSEPISVAFGTGAAYWYRNYVDVNYTSTDLLHPQVSYLIDRKRIQIPFFIDQRYDGFVSFRLAYHREDPLYPDRTEVSIRHGAHAVSHTLVERQPAKEVILSLGHGVSAFELRDVLFETALPSRAEQQANRAAGVAQDFALIPIVDMRVWGLPRRLPKKYVMDVNKSHMPWLERASGLYGLERHGDGYFIWGKPEAALVLPPADEDGALHSLKVTMVSHRPDDFPAEPQWFWNDTGIDPVHIKNKSGNVSVYHFSNIRFQGHDENVLRVLSREWIPARDSNIGDSRALGLGFVQLEWQQESGE